MDEVKFYMEESIISIDGQASVVDAGAMMRESKVGLLFVGKDDHYIGVISEGDLAKKVVAGNMDLLETSVADVMSSPIVSIDGNTRMVDAFFQMRKNNFRHIAVSEKKKVVGILSIKDFATYYINKVKEDKK